MLLSTPPPRTPRSGSSHDRDTPLARRRPPRRGAPGRPARRDDARGDGRTAAPDREPLPGRRARSAPSGVRWRGIHPARLRRDGGERPRRRRHTRAHLRIAAGHSRRAPRHPPAHRPRRHPWTPHRVPHPARPRRLVRRRSRARDRCPRGARGVGRRHHVDLRPDDRPRRGSALGARSRSASRRC